MINTAKIIKRQGRQYIPNIELPVLPTNFKNGRIEITELPCKEGCNACEENCPTSAIAINPSLSLDMGKCVFCNECARVCSEDKFIFTNDYKTATNERSRLIIKEGIKQPITLNPELIRKEIHQYFGGSLKLRQVSAGGDNSCEWEVNAAENVNFDMGRYGINFVASPRHADGLVLTGPISSSMAAPLESCYHAINHPKLLILVGVDAINGGIFQDSKAVNRTFLEKYPVDLYVPGNPPHPLTFILGILELIRKQK
ncbi:MAG: NADH:ubiquinone oxidoreductase [Cytophagales bacterium]|nr:MAG: NADH:ubiquinone oxidoreductase [Cytophagales bacterium]